MKYSLHKRAAKVKALLMALIIVCSVSVPQLTAKAAPNEVAQAALGIDVSRYQGQINWVMVAASGVQFAIVRVEYRT